MKNYIMFVNLCVGLFEKRTENEKVHEKKISHFEFHASNMSVKGLEQGK